MEQTGPHASLRLRRYGIVVAVALFVLLVAAGPALAHVDLESSNPSDGTSVSAAPEAIELRFTSEAVPAGEGVVLAASDGSAVPAEVLQTEPTVVVLVPEDPLPNGVYGVLWTMRAGDAHPRSGTFTFQVDAPPVTSTTVTTPGPSAGAGTGEGEDREVGTPEAAVPGGPADTPEVPQTDPSNESGAPVEAAPVAVELEPVFEVRTSEPPVGRLMGTIGRWAVMAGALVGIGAFAFAATSLIGTRREVEEAAYWVRRAGVLVIVGTAVEALGASMVLEGSVWGGLSPYSLIDALTGSFGLAVLLRIVGGVLMIRGMAILATEASSPVADAARLPGPSRPSGDTVVLLDRTEPSYRLDVHHSRVAIVGIAVVAASFLFDGHTVTTSPTLLVRAASATHVLAGGVWVGGVLLMAWTLARRHRRGADLGAAAMVIRFSRVASVAVAAVAVAGTALAIAILDTPSELLTTSWGRVLIIKLLAVAAAAAIGAYNHFVTVPALESDPEDAEAGDRLRNLVRVEGVILLVVVVVTAVLVGAAS